MKFHILTLFPEIFKSLNVSILKKAIENNKIDIDIINIRDFSKDKHRKVDEKIYGGGAGMLIRPDVVYDSYMSIPENIRQNSRVIYLTPKGKVLNQKKVVELSKLENIILLCGHYEGIDERVIEEIVDEEISIGDYILTGGEIPAMVLIDSISRNIDGVISKESLQEESFNNNILEGPQYTKPLIFKGKEVPKILLSGNHQEISKFRKEEAIKATKQKRPELLEK
ncbi:MAG: tRNA (guanosine(37)-N1)-methyltransferase TrmD [Clostridium sp.]